MKLPVKLIVLISALVFRANCREYIDGPDNQAASPIHPRHFPGGLLNPDFSGEELHISNGLDELESFEWNSLPFDVNQQLKKDVTEQNQNELRGNSGKGSIKKLIKSLESMERKLTQANQELKTELQTIKEQQANFTNMNTELKTDLHSIGAVITNHTAILESIKDCNPTPVTPPTSTTTTTTVAPTTDTNTTTVAPTTTTTEIPAGFENFNGRIIRRTLSSDPKAYFDGCMSFCDRYGAKPFIPRSKADYQLYLDIKAPFITNDYMWLPANDRQHEGTLRWYNGELASNTLFEWRNGQDMIHNTESADCLFYGCCSSGVADVYLNGCNNHKGLPPICEII